MFYSIKNEYYTLTVSDMGAELVSVRSKSDKELMWQKSEGEKFWSSHAPILFPVCGRLKDAEYSYGGVTYKMAAHGFAMRKLFKLKSSNDNSLVFSLGADAETLAQYPFKFELLAEYRLEGEEIIFKATVKNLDANTLPYMFGWHPGFALFTDGGQDIEDYTLDFGEGLDSLSWCPLQNGPFASETLVDYPLTDNKYKLCEKEIYENDTLIWFGHNNKVTLSADGHPYALDMSWSDNVPALCIWKDNSNAAKYLCIEPWTGVPNNGVDKENFERRKMERLYPGEKAEYAYKLKFKL